MIVWAVCLGSLMLRRLR